MRALFFTSIIFLSSCTVEPVRDNHFLVSQFKHYKSSYNKSAEKNYFSSDLWRSIQKARLNRKTSVFTGSLAGFPNEPVKNIRFKEKLFDKKGCLMVQGKNAKNIPMDYYIDYRFINHKWVMTGITVKYFLDGEKRYLKQAVCDGAERARLWIRHINKQ